MPDSADHFEHFKLNKQLLNAVEEMGYSEPTPIQNKAIPLGLNGQDILGIAQTGTGKTAAYLLPILMKTKYAQGNDPRALVLAPTRELALQIEEAAKAMAKYTDLRIVTAYGGVGPKTQIELIKAGADLIIATPGRFMDLYLKGDLVTKQLKTLVLDEADKMMDMGFMPQIRRILEVIPRKRQNLLFSATMPERVVELSHEFLEFPTTVEVTPEVMAVETVKQVLYEVPNLRTKINFVGELLKDDSFSRVIIFTRTKQIADNVFKFIGRKCEGEVRVIHSNKGQNTRINSMDDFKSGEVRVLVSTDVAARGIDVSMVSHVINFDVPVIYEDYVHRIGRTGRAKNEGKAITFANEIEMFHIEKIETLIKETIPRRPVPAEVKIEKTDFAEQQEIAREIDAQKRKADPSFKGAFHEKRKVFEAGKKSGYNSRKRKNRR